jgi:hypothetical protein
MVRCPECGERIRARTLLTSDLRAVDCTRCSAILAVRTRLGLLPAILLIFLGPPLAKSAQAGWLSIPAAIAVGALLLAVGAWIGYRASSATLVRHRHRRGVDATPDGSSSRT